MFVFDISILFTFYIACFVLPGAYLISVAVLIVQCQHVISTAPLGLSG
jgi:hypothetical protein